MRGRLSSAIFGGRSGGDRGRRDQGFGPLSTHESLVGVFALVEVVVVTVMMWSSLRWPRLRRRGTPRAVGVISHLRSHVGGLRRGRQGRRFRSPKAPWRQRVVDARVTRLGRPRPGAVAQAPEPCVVTTPPAAVVRVLARDVAAGVVLSGGRCAVARRG